MNSDPDTGEPEAVLDQARYFPETERPTVAVDRCIAPQIEALWQAGIRTRACCCGHNGAIPMAPMVALAHARDAEAAFNVLANDNRDWWINIWAGRTAARQSDEVSDGSR